MSCYKHSNDPQCTNQTSAFLSTKWIISFYQIVKTFDRGTFAIGTETKLNNKDQNMCVIMTTSPAQQRLVRITSVLSGRHKHGICTTCTSALPRSKFNNQLSFNESNKMHFNSTQIRVPSLLATWPFEVEVCNILTSSSWKHSPGSPGPSMLFSMVTCCRMLVYRYQEGSGWSMLQNCRTFYVILTKSLER